MKSHLLRFVDKFTKSISSETAAIFAGAGLSVASGLVNWKNLLRDMADELELDVDKETDLISLAQYYENEKGGRGCINKQLIEQFTKDVEETENHRILASLPIKTFWTTNYDNLIEKTLNKVGKITDTKICSANLAVNKPQRDAIIYKMHGDISLSHEAVLTKDDYESYNEKRQLFTTALQGDLISKTFLFMGFSFEDPNLEYILSRIRILLGSNTPDHYCFLKSISRSEYGNEDDYSYAKIKLEYKIKDLKRYGIQALMIDDYSEITNVLKLIYAKIKRRNIFISGAAHEFGSFTKDDAENLVFDLAYKLAEKNYKIISGFGLGIGSSVINGVLKYAYSKKIVHMDNYLIMSPFPQNISDRDKRKEMWKKYRHTMLSEAGIAIFFFGNKLVDGKIVLSDGLMEEFEIAVELGLKVVPVGCTGYVSKELWNKVISAYDDYYPNDPEIRESIEILGDEHIDKTRIISNLLKVINTLQNHI